MAHHRRSFCAVAAALALAACGGSSSPAAAPSTVVAERLQGSWQLAEFRPSLALEAPLQGLLDAQLKSLTIVFQGSEFTASGPGVETGGRFEIASASGDSFSGRIYDRAGAGYGVSGQFMGDQLRFTCTDTPWSGSGFITRVK